MVFLRAGKITARSRPIEFGWSSRKEAKEFPKLVLELPVQMKWVQR